MKQAEIIKGIPVLMYHALEDDVHPAGAKNLGEQLYVLCATVFREQMRYLHENGFQTFLVKDLLAMENWPRKAIVITFDDGHESNYTLALPILQEFGFKAEFFIATGWTDANYYLKAEQINALYQAGMAIGSHSVSHPYFDDLSDDEIDYELRESRSALTAIINEPISNFSGPGGRLPNSIKFLAPKSGYSVLHTSIPGLFKKGQSQFSIPRFAMRRSLPLEEFIKLVNLDPVLLFKIKAKAWMLSFAKRILGNKRYEKFRDAAL